MSRPDAPAGAARAEQLIALFRDGAQAAREILVENEALRRRIAELEAAADADARQARICALEEELHGLTSLYAASCQLHASLHLPEVVSTIGEVLVNLVGVDAFALRVLDEATRRLEVVAAAGLDPSGLGVEELGKGFAGEALAAGVTRFAPEGGEKPSATPLVAVPLAVKERPVGVITIHRLLPHKPGLTSLDLALFELLARHAATAIAAARAFAESERKLHTVRGFLELLSPPGRGARS